MGDSSKPPMVSENVQDVPHHEYIGSRYLHDDCANVAKVPVSYEIVFDIQDTSWTKSL